MTADPTAAERARRYRARRRERDGSVTSRHDGLDPLVAELLVEIRALRADVNTLVHRDVTPPSRAARDVTQASRADGAPAPARVGTRLTSPTGSSEPTTNHRDVTPAGQRILDTLGRAHSGQSAAAIADALDLRAVDVISALVELAGLGRVYRIAASGMRERDRWQLAGVVEQDGETIVCRAYREHAIGGHRRDPGTGRFRCYICEPEPIAPPDADGGRLYVREIG